MSCRQVRDWSPIWCLPCVTHRIKRSVIVTLSSISIRKHNLGSYEELYTVKEERASLNAYYFITTSILIPFNANRFIVHRKTVNVTFPAFLSTNSLPKRFRIISYIKYCICCNHFYKAYATFPYHENSSKSNSKPTSSTVQRWILNHSQVW